MNGNNIKVLPPKIITGGMSMMANSCSSRGNGCFPPPKPCMPYPGCCMPPPMCGPYSTPLCYPSPCPPPQIICCPQPYPMCPFPCMPPPNCCPPTPCLPPPCCSNPCEPSCNPFARRQTSCCGAGATLVCVPKGTRPNTAKQITTCAGAINARNGTASDPSASYNNCNFYVTEMPKGLGNVRPGFQHPPEYSEDDDEEMEECYDQSDLYGNHAEKNFPAGDGMVVPPPFGYPGSQKRAPWGNDNTVIGNKPTVNYNPNNRNGQLMRGIPKDVNDNRTTSTGRFGGGGRGRDVRNVVEYTDENEGNDDDCSYISDRPETSENRSNNNNNARNFNNSNRFGRDQSTSKSPVPSAYSINEGKQREISSDRPRSPYGNKTVSTGDDKLRFLNTATDQTTANIDRNNMGNQNIRPNAQNPGNIRNDMNENRTPTAERFGTGRGRNGTNQSYNSSTLSPLETIGSSIRDDANVPNRGYGGNNRAGTFGPNRPFMKPNAVRPTTKNIGQERGETSGKRLSWDDEVSFDGRGIRTKGGYAGGPRRIPPTVGYCIPQDYHNRPVCEKVVWRRKFACCMPGKSRRLKTLCQKCHERYAPNGMDVDPHCGLPTPNPTKNTRGRDGGFYSGSPSSAVSGQSKNRYIPNPVRKVINVNQVIIPAGLVGTRQPIS